MASWLLVGALLAAGGWVLLVSWDGFIKVGINYGGGRVPDRHAAQVAMYALPGFEAGLLVGILLRASIRGGHHAVGTLTAAVWVGVVLNFLLVGLLRPY